MSLVQSLPALKSISFPRVSGDEPWTHGGGVPTGVFSPRERG